MEGRWLKSFRARHKCSDIGPSQQFACRQQRMCRQTPPLSLIEGPLRGTAQYADRVDALGFIFVVVVLEYLTVIFSSLRKIIV